jgi:integrase
MKGKITKRAVDALSGAGGKEVILWDTDLHGFGIRSQGGDMKTYVLQYRTRSARGAPQRRLTIGKHGSPWTPDTARAEAKRLLGLVAAGRDPQADRQERRNTLTVSEVCDLYLAEGTSHKKRSTLKADRGRIEHHLKPLVGRRLIDQIARADIERMLLDVTAGKTAAPVPREGERPSGSIATGGAGVAAQCVTLLGTILTFAVARSLRTNNPAHGIKKPPVRKMERFLTEPEIARLAEALDSEAAQRGNPFPIGAIKLLLLTGCRRGEIIGLQWQHVDFERRCLRLPDSKESKGGNKVIYLNPPALELLSALPRLRENPHVIAGKRLGAPFGGLDKVWFRVRRAAGLDDVRLHDLRHSFASIGAAGGLSLPVIGALLGHKHAATTARYAHLSADPLRAANDLVGARIAAAMIRPADATPAADSVNRPLHRRDASR